MRILFIAHYGATPPTQGAMRADAARPPSRRMDAWEAALREASAEPRRLQANVGAVRAVATPP